MKMAIGYMLACAVALLPAGGTALAQGGYGTEVLPPFANDPGDSYMGIYEQFPDANRPSMVDINANALQCLENQSCTPGVWSPDGTFIAVGEFMSNALFLIPVNGGAPVPVFKNIQNFYDYVDGWWFRKGDMWVIGFTPEGDLLYTEHALIHATVVQHPHDACLDNREYTYVVRAVNITNGAVRDIAENSQYAIYSPAGRYLAVSKNDAEGNPSWTELTDTSTGTATALPFSTFGFNFTPDEQSIIGTDGGMLIRYDIPNGRTETIGANANILTTLNFPYISGCIVDISPDGRWLLCTIGCGERDVYPYRYDDQPNRPYHIDDIPILHAYNLETGETIQLVPDADDIQSCYGSFSPDGTRYCYWHRDLSKIGVGEDARHLDHPSSMFIKDFPIPMDFSDLQLAVADDSSPAAFAIAGNYPNPFNPATTIAFTLDTPGRAMLTVYNLAGQAVRTLEDGSLPAGRHEVVWDGTDDAGVRVSSGIYMARLDCNGASAAHRMTLMK